MNLTNCTATRLDYSSCGNWTPSSGQCDQVCVEVKSWQKLSIMSCGRTLSSYSKVYSVDTNLTVGYNLIVIPEEQRFTTHEGDIVGFYRNTSGAALQRMTAGQDTDVYFYPANHMFNLTMDLKNGVAVNVSFRIKLHSSINVRAVITVSCLNSVGLYSLMTTFANAISSYNDSKVLAFRSLIAVQNPISPLRLTFGSEYVKVNTTKDITAAVTQGTNVSCEWYVPNSSITVPQSPYLKNNNTTEGGVFQYSSLYRYAGYIPIVVTAYNLVSRERKTIYLSVRQPIKGLKVDMCYGAFAYDNAHTCFNSSVTHGTYVGCTWAFKNPNTKKNDYIAKEIGKIITREFTPVGDRHFTLYCYNKISTVSVNYSVKVVDNPLSIDAPLNVPADEPIKITCQVNWSGGTPASFFAQQGVTGKKGTDIAADPILTLKSGRDSNSSSGTVILYRRFKRLLYRKHKVTCKTDNYPDLNALRLVKAMYRIAGINVTSNCPSRVEVGKTCTFQVQISRGDHPTFTWTVSESDNRVAGYNGRKIPHQFLNKGLANVTVTVSNEVSSRENTTYFFVYSLSTREPHVTTSPSIPIIQPSSITEALHSSSSVSRHSIYGTKTLTSIIPTRTISSNSTTSIPNQIPSLKDARLRHASVGFVGHAITFSVDHVQKPHLFRFIWNWDDKSALEEAGFTLTHTFTDPGQYFIAVNISSVVDHVVLRGHVTVQYRIKGLLIRDLAVRSSNVLLVKFEILQGTNVSYSVEYGDDAGE